jgi:DNA-binding transcriptional regulator YhcF (GntR family)
MASVAASNAGAPDERGADPAGNNGDASIRLSYKFQRLREKLREAISAGELSGRLPGERKLARKFRVNAKTLSKALTDLAAEGLLDRSIGRGTFVKGSSEPVTSAIAEKWLIICDEDQSRSAIVQNLLAANPDAQCSIGMPPQRPSFLNPFKAVVIFCRDIPEAFIRDLVVRNIAVVIADRQPGTYSTHAVLIDRSHGASVIARDLMLDGHRHLGVVEERGNTELTTAVRNTARRYAPDATIETLDLDQAQAAIEHGVTAIICDSFDAADALRARFDELHLEIPRRISLAAIGSGNGDCRCSGYFVPPNQFSQTVVEILRDNTAKRPVTLFLPGKSIDCGTTGPTEGMIDPAGRLRYAPVSA